MDKSKLETFYGEPKFGITVNKDTNEQYERIEKNNNVVVKVKHTINGVNLIIEEETERIANTGEKVKDYTRREIELKEGTRLIYTEENGFEFPIETMKSLDEIKE